VPSPQPTISSPYTTAATNPRARSAFLAEAGRLLAESLDYESILQQVADAAVPTFADWCGGCHPLQRDGGWPPVVRRVAVAGRDPNKLAWARKLGVEVERDWGSPNGLPQVLRTGLAAFFPEITEDLIRRAGLSEQEKAIFLRIGLTSAICVPLVARGRTFGAISLGMAESRRRYNADDLALAKDLASYAAIAIDNARLYANEREARLAAERAALRIERLQSVTAALSHARTPAQVGRVIVDHGLDALGASYALVYITSESGTSLDLVCAAGVQAEALDRLRRIPIHANHPAADALRARAPVFIANATERADRYPNLNAPSRGAESSAALPLLRDRGLARSRSTSRRPRSRPRSACRPR
jgi:GAF domain-containing protein